MSKTKKLQLSQREVYRVLSRRQKNATKEILKEFLTERRTKCIMACATGKSRVTQGVILMMDRKVNVVAVPNLQLVQQMISLFTSIQEMQRYAVLPVCSKIGDESPEDFEIHDATTDPKKILSVCRGKQPVIVVVTYQSYETFAKAIKGKVKVDLLVSDEAHRTAGEHGKEFSLCLHDSALRVQYRLFMTATPVIYRGEKDSVHCMNDPKVYGKAAYEYPYTVARDEGVVAPIETQIFSIPTGDAADKANKLQEANHQAFLAESLIAQKLRPRQKTKMLVFHNTVQASQAFTEKLQAAGVWAVHLNGSHPVKYRKQKIDEFSQRKGCAVICSVKVFSEGVDAPEIDAIVFAEKKGSIVDIVQSIGRGTRWAEGKTSLKLIIPYFTERKLTAKKIQEEILASKYGPLMDVVLATASMDESLAEYRIKPKRNHDAVQGVQSADVDGDFSWLNDDSESVQQIDNQKADQKEPLANRVTFIKKLPVTKVSILTDDGEFDAEDVRTKYISGIKFKWPYDQDHFYRFVVSLFGANRPPKHHPHYARLIGACKLRGLSACKIMDHVYGSRAFVWPMNKAQMTQAARKAFGILRPATSHPLYQSFINACRSRTLRPVDILDEVYGASKLRWPVDVNELFEFARMIFGVERPGPRHPRYASFGGVCKTRGISRTVAMDHIWGPQKRKKSRWPEEFDAFVAYAKKVFSDTRPQSDHPEYDKFMHACISRGFNAKHIFNVAFGVKKACN